MTETPGRMDERAQWPTAPDHRDDDEPCGTVISRDHYRKLLRDGNGTPDAVLDGRHLMNTEA